MQIKNLSLSFGVQDIFKDITISIKNNEKLLNVLKIKKCINKEWENLNERNYI